MKNRRRIKLIQPRLQLRLILTFVGISACSMLLQFILFTSKVTELVSALPSDSMVAAESVPSLLFSSFLISFLIFLPLMLWIGALATLRLAGPVYRFELFLRQVIRGEKPGDCTLRKGDEMKGLCRLINQATEPLRRRQGSESKGDSASKRAA